MKKVSMLLTLALLVGVALFVSSCGKDDKKNSVVPNGLPTGWSVDWGSIPDVWYNEIHVGNSVTFYIKVYDENNQEVTTYDTSSTTWWVEQTGTIVTLSDTTGTITYITAQSAGSFVLHCDFKGSHIYQTITIKP